MAKKNLSHLMTGILGQEPVGKAAEVKQPLVQSSQEVKARRGRPSSRAVAGDYVRTTFIFDKDKLNQLRYIALVEKKTLTEIVNKLIEDYISWWEDANGKTPIHLKNR